MNVKMKSGITVILMAVLMACGLLWMGSVPAFAAEDDPDAMVYGTSVLGKNVNEQDAQIVTFGGREWYVISYDNEGDSLVRQNGLITMLHSDADKNNAVDFNKYIL